MAILPAGMWGVGGDSRTLMFNSGSRDTRYPQTWFENALGEYVRFSKDKVFSLGGITSTTFVSTYLPNLLAAPTVGSFVMIGGNDRSSSITPTTSFQNVVQVVEGHKAVKKGLILCNDYPFQTFNTDQLVKHREFRYLVDSLHDPANGIIVANTWDALVGADGFQIDSAMLKDLVHPTVIGAVRMANAAITAAKGRFTKRPSLFARPNPLYNPNSFSGWTAPSYTGLTVTDTILNGIATRRLIFNNAAGNTGAVATFFGPASIPVGFTAGTSLVDSIIGYRIMPGLTGLRSLALSTYHSGGQTLAAVETGNASDGADGGSGAAMSLPNFGFSGILHPSPGLLPGTANRVQQVITVAGLSPSIPINGEIQLFMPQLRALDSYGL